MLLSLMLTILLAHHYEKKNIYSIETCLLSPLCVKNQEVKHVFLVMAVF